MTDPKALIAEARRLESLGQYDPALVMRLVDALGAAVEDGERLRFAIENGWRFDMDDESSEWHCAAIDAARKGKP